MHINIVHRIPAYLLCNVREMRLQIFSHIRQDQQYLYLQRQINGSSFLEYSIIYFLSIEIFIEIKSMRKLISSNDRHWSL